MNENMQICIPYLRSIMNRLMCLSAIFTEFIIYCNTEMLKYKDNNQINYFENLIGKNEEK